MKSFYFIFAFLALFSITSINNSINVNADAADEASAIDKAKGIFDNIKKSKFVDTMKSVSKWGLPLLKSIGYLAKFVTAFIETESKELKFMKEQFKIINQKMDFVDNEFEEVKRAIDWNSVKIQYSKYEMSINIMQDLTVQIPETDKDVRPIIMDKFMQNYEQIYDSAADKLYESLMNDHLYSDNLVKAIRKYTDDNKSQVEKFFMGNINLLLKGLQVEKFYNAIQNLTTSEDHWDQMWDERIKKLTKMMETTSEEIRNNWFDQVQTDTETFNVKNYQKDNRQYLDDFYSFLSNKYPWRQWAVVVYNDLSSDYNHFVGESGGSIKFRLRGKNVVFGSVQSGPYRPQYNYAGAQQALNEVRTKILSWGSGPAKTIWRDLSSKLSSKKVTHSVSAVIAWGGGVWYKAPYHSYRKWEGTYNRFIDVGKTFNLIVMM